jgi:hypothetical protein
MKLRILCARKREVRTPLSDPSQPIHSAISYRVSTLAVGECGGPPTYSDTLLYPSLTAKDFSTIVSSFLTIHLLL